MNIEAAEQALHLFNKTREGGELGDLVDTLETDIIDLITDLLHLYKENESGVDPTALLRSAENHFETEISESQEFDEEAKV